MHIRIYDRRPWSLTCSCICFCNHARVRTTTCSGGCAELAKRWTHDHLRQSVQQGKISPGFLNAHVSVATIVACTFNQHSLRRSIDPASVSRPHCVTDKLIIRLVMRARARTQDLRWTWIERRIDRAGYLPTPKTNESLLASRSSQSRLSTCWILSTVYGQTATTTCNNNRGRSIRCSLCFPASIAHLHVMLLSRWQLRPRPR